MYEYELSSGLDQRDMVKWLNEKSRQGWRLHTIQVHGTTGNYKYATMERQVMSPAPAAPALEI